MTVGELRGLLTGVPDDFKVFTEDDEYRHDRLWLKIREQDSEVGLVAS